MPDAITANLSLPLMAAAQAQKHVTHNEALVGLDTLVQLAVLDKDLTAPPANPAEGDRYLIAGASPTGAWAGWGGRVVRYQDGAWRSFPPRPGWLAFVADEADLYTYTGGAWASFRSTLTVLQNLTRLGIGTTADAGNPFAAKLNKALWTALTTGEGGSGDLRTTLNKQAAGNVLSLLFQSGFSGRAELGLTGDDDLRLKVSGDGGTWREALRVDRNTGGLDFAAAEVSAPIAGTVDLGGLGAVKVVLTGSGTVTSFGTAPNRVRLLRFTAAATLTHNAASLVLPGGANLVTAAGDTAVATSDAAGTWRVVDYARASGKAVTAPSAAEVGLGATNTPTLAGLFINGSPGTYRTLTFQSNYTTRFVMFAGPETESGNNVGSNFAINRYADNGDYVDTPFAINRATGQTSLSSLTVNARGSFQGITVNAVASGSPALVVGDGSADAGPTYGMVNLTRPSDNVRAHLALIRAGNYVWQLGYLNNTNAIGFFPFNFSGSQQGAPAIAFNTDSNVGIGTAAPAARLHVATGDGAEALRAVSGAAGLSFSTYAGQAYLWGSGTVLNFGTTSAHTLNIGTNNATRIQISAAGEVTFGSAVTFTQPAKFTGYTVSTMPAGAVGMVIYVSNARKVGEAAGSGTGVMAYYSNGNWRRPSDDSPVAA
ncbi:DUF2793 domain-containing protein [uncultured Methylobacterium sp.]|uniref:DUF2793 domain-containing protein n=1 Tax=uncultured Methylobacterium sp. TaxID=157278 RepID=UPI00259980C3|nr:DUF2793 domain-containing protein [uncultured Methylobacterium sp.]